MQVQNLCKGHIQTSVNPLKMPLNPQGLSLGPVAFSCQKGNLGTYTHVLIIERSVPYTFHFAQGCTGWEFHLQLPTSLRLPQLMRKEKTGIIQRTVVMRRFWKVLKFQINLTLRFLPRPLWTNTKRLLSSCIKKTPLIAANCPSLLQQGGCM